jgi:ABC-type multidrug transport system ATPase subunit
MECLQIHELSKRFGREVIFDDVTIEARSGSIVSIVGLNGAGKSTLLNLCAAILSPNHGEVRIDGERLEHDRIDLRRRLAFLPDSVVGFGGWTPLRYAAILADLNEIDDPSFPDRFALHLDEMEALDLARKSLAFMSRGQIYKVALATILALDPELWLFDEPFASGMDAVGLAYFDEEVRAAAARGRIILYSTQLLRMAEGLATEAWIVHGKKVHRWVPGTQIEGGLAAAMQGLREASGRR